MNKEEIYTVVVIEDNEEVRSILREYIESCERYFLAGVYETCEKALKNLKHDLPKIVLMDVDLPGMNGIEGTKKIKQVSPQTEVIIFTVFENSETVFSALCAGASGYLTKNTQRDELLSSIDECIKGGAPMSMKIARMVVHSFARNRKSPLTDRETEILTLLATGKSYNSIADQLFISKDTVKYHIKNIYIKLQVDNKEAAIDIANREKFI
jgi:DNA-binding NarL/FixJ family response regulator